MVKSVSLGDLFKAIPPERGRTPIPRTIVQRVSAALGRFPKVPRGWSRSWEFKWRNNPVKDSPHLHIPSDIKVIRVKNRRAVSMFTTKSVYYKESDIGGLRLIDSSCVVVDDTNHIVLLFMVGRSDGAIAGALSRAPALMEKMRGYYRKKPTSFYNSGTSKSDRRGYYGENYMDGMIRSMKPNYGRQFLDYQPRKPAAMEDAGFLTDLVFTYGALYELEKRYAPAVARYREELSLAADFPGLFPGVPLSLQPATGVGASIDFASRIHKDSSMIGTTETIMWTPCDKGHRQLFVVPEVSLAFDLSKEPCVMLISPEIVHGTAYTGEHGGLGFVAITKKNLVSTTAHTKQWYQKWKARFTKR